MRAFLFEQISQIWKVVFGVFVFLGIIFWFTKLTDYLWSEWRANYAICILVIVFSLLALAILNRLPSFLGAAVFLVIALTVPLSGLSLLLYIPFENKALFKVTPSPGRARIIEVYCSTDGGHGGTDHVEIFMKNERLPFLTRVLGVYNKYPSRDCAYDAEFPVRWIDNNTIHVAERDVDMGVGLINWDPVLRLPGEIRGTH